jgi:predicted ArsR family transcriptional regulator
MTREAGGIVAVHDAILASLDRRPATSETIAIELDKTDVWVRQAMRRLVLTGLVRYDPPEPGVARHARRHHITDKGREALAAKRAELAAMFGLEVPRVRD